MDAKQIIEIAFKEARKVADGTTLKLKGEKKFIELDLKRLNTVHAIILGFLNSYIKQASFELNDFEKELMGTMINYEKKNKQAEKIKNSIRILKSLKEEHEIKIKYAEHRRKSDKIRKAYYGRVSSVVKKIKFDEIEMFQKLLPQLPKMKRMQTIIIAGCPNVGKSQILKTMSGKDVKTAPYPFTTKELLVGFIKDRYAEIQIIDTPGVLDRAIEQRNEIEKRAILAMKYLSKNILFVLDPSETCGYSLDDQLSLKKEVEEKFKPKMFVVATKKDIVRKPELQVDFYVNAKDEKDIEELKAKIIKFFF